MTSSRDDRAPREGALLRGALAARAVSYRDAGPSPTDRRTAIRRAADQPVPPAEIPEAAAPSRPAFRPGGVYAEGPGRVRHRAHAGGFPGGHTPGRAPASPGRPP